MSEKSHWLDSWHVNPSANRDYDFIDGLRGVAILMVLTCHHLYVNPQSSSAVLFVGGLFTACGHGVTLFFALSGFLISWPFWECKFSLANQVIPFGYGWRRFWKIYPPLALSVLLLLPGYIFLLHDWSCGITAIKWLSGLPFIVPVDGKFNPVMWTLVIEVQFYIFLPLVFFCLKKVSPAPCLWIITSFFFIIPFLFRIVTGLSPTFHPDINSHFPSALDGFALGIFLAGLENWQGKFKKNWTHFGILGLVLWPLSLLTMAWMLTHPNYQNFTMAESVGWMEKIASGCLLCYIANPQHLVVRLLRAPWLRWCGIISYEWYLFHQPIIMWARNFFGAAGGNYGKYIAIVGGSFLASLFISALIYRWFSLPILKYGRMTMGKK